MEVFKALWETVWLAILALFQTSFVRCLLHYFICRTILEMYFFQNFRIAAFGEVCFSTLKLNKSVKIPLKFSEYHGFTCANGKSILTNTSSLTSFQSWNCRISNSFSFNITVARNPRLSEPPLLWLLVLRLEKLENETMCRYLGEYFYSKLHFIPVFLTFWTFFLYLARWNHREFCWYYSWYSPAWALSPPKK